MSSRFYFPQGTFSNDYLRIKAGGELVTPAPIILRVISACYPALYLLLAPALPLAHGMHTPTPGICKY